MKVKRTSDVRGKAGKEKEREAKRSKGERKGKNSGGKGKKLLIYGGKNGGKEENGRGETVKT